MSKVIHKYPLEITGEQTIIMPYYAEILSIQYQSGPGLEMWALVSEKGSVRERKFAVIGTGHKYDNDFFKNKFHIETVQVDGFVWHVFEQVKTPTRWIDD